MKTTVAELMRRLPGPATRQWPQGERFAEAFRHGSMSVELYAPVGSDPQAPHAQDELYFIQSGNGTFLLDGVAHEFEAGDCFFVAAGVEHRFTHFTPGFATWVVFWGPEGGE
jgi:mannose-6-phosphate isomerase-like protein (cupin superfamily)